MEAKIKQIKYKPTLHTGDREIEREKDRAREPLGVHSVYLLRPF